MLTKDILNYSFENYPFHFQKFTRTKHCYSLRINISEMFAKYWRKMETVFSICHSLTDFYRNERMLNNNGH